MIVSNKVKLILVSLFLFTIGVCTFALFKSLPELNQLDKDLKKVESKIEKVEESNSTYKDQLEQAKSFSKNQVNDYFENYKKTAKRFLKANTTAAKLNNNNYDKKSIKEVSKLAKFKQVDTRNEISYFPFSSEVKVNIDEDSAMKLLFGDKNNIDFAWEVLYKRKTIGFITRIYDVKADIFLDMEMHYNNYANTVMNEVII